MNRLRVFALSALGLLGPALGPAQAGWHRDSCRPVGPPPAVACAPAPCPPPVVCPPVVRPYHTYHRPAVYHGPRVAYRHHCR
jgi:hypothetical protein